MFSKPFFRVRKVYSSSSGFEPQKKLGPEGVISGRYFRGFFRGLLQGVIFITPVGFRGLGFKGFKQGCGL